MYPADLMLVKQKFSWQRSGPDCKCQFKNWHNSKVFKKITVFLPFFDFDQIDVEIGVFCLQKFLAPKLRYVVSKRKKLITIIPPGHGAYKHGGL